MAKKSRSHLAQQPQQLNNTRLESLVELNKQFGSKRTKRRTEQQERMKMDVETVREQLEETVANVKISETDHSLMMGGGGGNTTMDGSTYRPPCNRDATTKEDVYVVSEIVPDVVLDSFADEAAEAYSGNNDKLVSVRCWCYILDVLLVVLFSLDCNRLLKTSWLNWLTSMVHPHSKDRIIFKKNISYCYMLII